MSNLDRLRYNLINWTSLPKAIVSKNLTIFLRSKNIGSLIKLLAGLKCLATKTKRFWKWHFWTLGKISALGNGYGSVGRAVASNSRGQQFESSHRKNVYTNIYCQLFWKDKNKEKEAWNGPFLKEHFRRLVRYLMASTLARKKINLSIYQCDQIGLFWNI